MCTCASIDRRRTYVVHTLALTLLTGGLGGWAWFTTFPEHYFRGYPVLPVFFFLLGVGMVDVVERCRKSIPQKSALMYLLIRMGRTLLSLVFLLTGCLAIRGEALKFTLAFAVFYVIYLAYDTWFFGVRGNKNFDKSNISR